MFHKISNVKVHFIFWTYFSKQKRLKRHCTSLENRLMEEILRDISYNAWSVVNFINYKWKLKGFMLVKTLLKKVLNNDDILDVICHDKHHKMCYQW